MPRFIHIEYFNDPTGLNCILRRQLPIQDGVAHLPRPEPSKHWRWWGENIGAEGFVLRDSTGRTLLS